MTLPQVHDVAGSKTGTLIGKSTDSGHAWSPTGSSLPVYRAGAITFAAGVNTAQAGYARVQLSSRTRRVGGRFRFEPNDGFRGAVTVGVFETSAIPSQAPIHLSITQTYAEFGVFTSAGGAQFLAPEGAPSSLVRFAEPLRADGTSVYSVDVELDEVAGRVTVRLPDGRVVTYRHPAIADVVGVFPFWELYTQSTGEAIGGWTEVWADTAVPVLKATEAPMAEALRPAQPARGAGSQYARPASYSNPGMTWWDASANRPTFSTGEDWRDAAGAVVGNLLPPDVATMNADVASAYAVAGSGTGARSRVAPPRRSSSLKLTATGTSGVRTDTNAYFPVTAGQSYSALVAKTMTPGSTTQQGYAQISWYDASGNYLGSAIAAQAAFGASGAWAPTNVANGVAPAGATQAQVQLVWFPAAVGDVLHVTEYALARGSITEYLER